MKHLHLFSELTEICLPEAYITKEFVCQKDVCGHWNHDMEIDQWKYRNISSVEVSLSVKSMDLDF